jgi:hypothetical protein
VTVVLLHCTPRLFAVIVAVLASATACVPIREVNGF